MKDDHVPTTDHGQVWEPPRLTKLGAVDLTEVGNNKSTIEDTPVYQPAGPS